MKTNIKSQIVILGVIMSSIYSCSTIKKTYENTNNSTNIPKKVIDSTYWKGLEQNGVFLVSKNGFFGLADRNGNLLTEVIYDRIFPFNEGKAIMCQNNRYGVLDANGKEITPAVYQSLDDFAYGLCYGSSINGEDVMLNSKGENIVPGKNIRISQINGRYVQLEDWSIFVFNQHGEKVFSTKYYSDKWNIGIEKGEFRWFNGGGSSRVDGFQREPHIPQNLPFYFNDGLAVVPELMGEKVKFGYIDTKGKQVIPFVLDEAKNFINGYACAKADGKWGIIDQSGTWVLPPAFENLESTNGNYFIFTKSDLCGVVNLKGDVIIEPKYFGAKFLTRIKQEFENEKQRENY